ncbi:tRNA synthetases class I, catalytic domain-containing protein [Hyaloraphidium curvatum]|nr:tRNA synthetases class I, catalytic domain-containing protein [Hyaloraphidium curvatum]
MASPEELLVLFQAVGISEAKSKEVISNKKLSANLALAINESGLASGAEKATGSLIYTLASTITKDALPHLPYIARAITAGKLKTAAQVDAAVRFCDALPPSAGIVDADFDAACGVGVVVTPEEIAADVKLLLESRRAELEAERYKLASLMVKEAQRRLRWAPPLEVKKEVDAQVEKLLGPKDERDDPKLLKQKKKETKVEAPSAASGASAAKETAAAPAKNRVLESAKSLEFVFEGDLSRLHKPGGNKQIKEELMAQHLRETGGVVLTRFPPEPNGYLHIGHAKAMNVNFGYAMAHKGNCYLRYDDTNPEAEEVKFFDAILEMVRWLGFEPWKITYASDHFQRLYDLAVELIKKDKAYVCHCTQAQMKKNRGEGGGPRVECEHRNRPIEESLAEFQKMKDGRYPEGVVTLRMKMDMQNPNPQFWDLVAYRVLYTPHVRTGDAWCVYPTYDYVHCLCDSFENITHSLCTLEFQLARESYYWLCDALEVYKPVQWEYGRLNLKGSVMSKRKLRKLVEDGYVSGWDDPRLYTLAALRRRGFTPEAINAFVRELGVTTASPTIEVSRLENYVRDHLNEITPRLMVVLEPVKIVLTNLPEDYLEEITVANKPRDESMGTHVVPFTRTIYIDASDFREADEPNYFRLAPGKTIGLLNVPFPITATGFTKDPATGKVAEVHAVYENAGSAKKPKTYIQWVAESAKHSSPVKIEVREYSNLFAVDMEEDEGKAEEGEGAAEPASAVAESVASAGSEQPPVPAWLKAMNPDSLKVYPSAYAEVGVKGAKVEDKFQFLRLGYFCVDKDSDVEKGKLVFNLTCSLKEDSKKI